MLKVLSLINKFNTKTRTKQFKMIKIPVTVKLTKFYKTFTEFNRVDKIEIKFL